MNEKSIILSSFGLKNIVISPQKDEEEFHFINGRQEIKLPGIFAEFISPRVSHLHQCDPTINQLNFSNLLSTKKQSETKLFNDILNQDALSLIEQVTRGLSISVNEENERTLRHLSVFFGNEELFNKINEISTKEKSLEELIEDLTLYEEISGSYINFETSKMIDKISEQICSLNDQNKLKNLPRNIFYLIIKNKHFKRKDEDAFIDIINEMIKKSNEDDEKISDIELYEIVDLSKLSENKFREFLENFDFTQMTSAMWSKLCVCFFIKRVKKDVFEFDGNPTNRFKGIINHLRGNKKINIADEGIISVSASSTENPHYPKYAVDFDSDEYFHSDDRCGWLQYDFKDMKICPTKYSIKTSNDHDIQCPVNWCIEVSNTGQTNDWRVIDSRNNITSVSKRDQSDTFDIKTKLNSNECYRFVRFKSTGNTSGGQGNFVMASLEYFGSLIKSNDK